MSDSGAISDEELEWLDYVASETQDEELQALTLIDGEYILSNYFNTFDWINDFHARIDRPDLLPLVSAICEELGIVEYSRERTYFWDTDVDELGAEEMSRLAVAFGKIGERWQLPPFEPNYRLKSPVEIFLAHVNWGNYPPPEILASVAKCFNLYLQAKGDLSLEEVFYGKPKQRAGNFAARQIRYSSYRELHYSAIRERDMPNFNLQDFALKLMNYRVDEENPTMPLPHQLESYLRGYHRWKSDFDPEDTTDK